MTDLCHNISVGLGELKGFFATRKTNLVLFVLSCAMAWFFKWNAEDLAWSLWLSNFLIIGAIITCSTVLVSQKEAAFAVIGFGLFVLSIIFHMGQTVPLFATVPFNGTALIPNRVHETYAAVFAKYWMWLPIAFYHSRETLFYPPNPLKKDPNAKNPFKSLLFFTGLVYVLIGFYKLLGLDGFPAAVCVYFLYFFLFDRDLQRPR